MVLGSQPAGDVSHKPSGRLPLLSARPAVTLANLAAARGQRCFCDPRRMIDADLVLPARRYASAGTIATALCLFVCLRPSQVSVLSKRVNESDWFLV